jgi:hypothetical protein
MLVLQFALDEDNLDKLQARSVITESEMQLLRGMSTVERFQEATRNIKFEIRGFRAVIERDKFLARFAEFLSQLSRMPPAAQERLDWGRVISDAVEAYGFNPEEWLRQNTPQDKAREENALLKLNQQVALWEGDDDVAHLPVHYELILQGGPIPAAIAHTRAHMQRCFMTKGDCPPPPQEIAELLGLDAMSPSQVKQRGHLRAVEKDLGRKTRPAAAQNQ